jgi:hypothetical protein
MTEGGAQGLDPQKLSLCYAKLFQKQQAFAAQQAAVFAKLAAGDEATLEAVLKLPDAQPAAEEANGTGHGKKRKGKRDPDLPKRPKSGYQFYVCEHTPTLRAAQPEAKMTDLMGVLAADWKKLSEEEREKYQQLAVKEKDLYKGKMDNYNANKTGGGGGGGEGGGGGAAAKAAGPAAVAAKDAEEEEEEEEEDTESDTSEEKEVKKSKKKKHKKHKHKEHKG